VRVSSSVEGAISPAVAVTEYEVEEKPITQGNCWWCYGKLHLRFPIAQDYQLHSSSGAMLSPNAELPMYTDRPLVLWVKPSQGAVAAHGEAVKHALFNAWLSGPDMIKAAWVSPSYDERKGGYKVVVESRDAVASKLFVTQQLQWPNSERLREKEPEPVLLSSHMSHEINDCDLGRSEVFGSRVEVRPRHRASRAPALALPSQPRKCTRFQEEGRWLRLAEEEACAPPLCSGDKEAAEVSTMSWQGATYPYVWVPYECHVHFYSADDLAYCTEQLGIRWIHTMGDSLAREFVGYMTSIYGMPDTEKFEQLDSNLNGTVARITFQSWQDMLVAGPELYGYEYLRSPAFLQLMLDHYNLLQPNTSSPLEVVDVNLFLDETEPTAPDVFIMNPASAYALFQQTASAYDTFMHDFMELVGDKWDSPRTDGHRVRAWWYGHPYVHGTAHPGTEYLTQGRNMLFRSITRDYLDGHAIPYIDPGPMTSCRWEESFDGLHYLLGTTHWNGHVTAMVMQTLLNEILGECQGRPGGE